MDVMPMTAVSVEGKKKQVGSKQQLKQSFVGSGRGRRDGGFLCFCKVISFLDVWIVLGTMIIKKVKRPCVVQSCSQDIIRFFSSSSFFQACLDLVS